MEAYWLPVANDIHRYVKLPESSVRLQDRKLPLHNVDIAVANVEHLPQVGQINWEVGIRRLDYACRIG